MNNKFNVNTTGIANSEIGFFLVQGGKVYCTVGEFINMHYDECIEKECGDVVYNYKNKVVEKLGYPIGKASLGAHHPNSFLEGEDRFVPKWEGKDFVCYVDVAKTEPYILSDIKDGESIQRTIYETEFDFVIEHWDENRFYPRKPI